MNTPKAKHTPGHGRYYVPIPGFPGYATRKIEGGWILFDTSDGARATARTYTKQRYANDAGRTLTRLDRSRARARRKSRAAARKAKHTPTPAQYFTAALFGLLTFLF